MKKVVQKWGSNYLLKSLITISLFALMLCILPGFKVNAADRTISSKETWSDQSPIEVDNLIITEKGDLTLSNVHLIVKGDVRANGDIILKDGSVLDVHGDHIQSHGALDLYSGSTINVSGSLRFQQKNAAGGYSTANSRFYPRSGSEINVKNDFIADTSTGFYEPSINGTFNIYGDISIKSNDSNTRAFSNSTFNLMSDKPQTITLSPYIALGTLNSKCPTVNVTKYINICSLGNDITFTNPQREIHISAGKNMYNTKLVTFDGDLIIDYHDVNPINTMGGTINVNGNMRPLKGYIDLRGNLNVAKSLLFENLNANGEVLPAEAYFYPRKGSNITVGKDYVWNSIRNLSFVEAIMSLSGDYIDKQGASWNGTVKLLSKGQHVTILNGGYIKNLNLAYPRSEYFFNPDQCWKNLIEPVPAVQPSSGTTETVENNTAPTVQDASDRIDSSQKKVKISKVKSSRKKITITFKKSKKISGYEVQYDTSKKFDDPTTKNVGSQKTNVTIKKLKSKKTYYVRIRSYKTTAEGKIYSKWSTIKKVKVK